MAGIDNFTKLLLHYDTLPISDFSINESNPYNTIESYGTGLLTSTRKFGSSAFKGDVLNNYVLIKKYSNPSQFYEFFTESQKITVDFWLYSSNWTGTYNIFKNSSVSGGCKLEVINGKLALSLSNNYSTWDILNQGLSANSLNINIWYHIAITRIYNNPYYEYKIYINGINNYSFITSITLQPTLSPLRIGATSVLKSAFIDEFRISYTIRWSSDFPSMIPQYPYDNRVTVPEGTRLLVHFDDNLIDFSNDASELQENPSNPIVFKPNGNIFQGFPQYSTPYRESGMFEINNTTPSFVDSIWNNIGSNDWCVEFWARNLSNTDINSTNKILILGRCYDYTTYDWMIRTNTNNRLTLSVKLIPNEIEVSSSNNIIPSFDSTWHFYSISKDGNTIRFFKDGVIWGENSYFTSTLPSTLNVNIKVLGDNIGEIQGDIDDFVFIYGNAYRTAAFQIPQTPYDTPPAIPGGTKLLLHFNNNLNDYSPYTNQVIPDLNYPIVFNQIGKFSADRLSGYASIYNSESLDSIWTSVARKDFCLEFWGRNLSEGFILGKGKDIWSFEISSAGEGCLYVADILIAQSNINYATLNDEYIHYAISRDNDIIRFFKNGELWNTPITNSIEFIQGEGILVTILGRDSVSIQGNIDELIFIDGNSNGRTTDFSSDLPRYPYGGEAIFQDSEELPLGTRFLLHLDETTGDPKDDTNQFIFNQDLYSEYMEYVDTGSIVWKKCRSKGAVKVKNAEESFNNITNWCIEFRALNPDITTSGESFSLISKRNINAGWSLQVGNEQNHISSKLTFFRNGVYYSSDLGYLLKDDTWHHYAISYDTQYLRFFRDGVLITKLSVPASLHNNNFPMYIFETDTYNKGLFKGKVDELIFITGYAYRDSDNSFTTPRSQYGKITNKFISIENGFTQSKAKIVHKQLSISLYKETLRQLPIILQNSFFNNSNNWDEVIFEYKNTLEQCHRVTFKNDVMLGILTSFIEFGPTAQEGEWFINRVVLKDLDNKYMEIYGESKFNDIKFTLTS